LRKRSAFAMSESELKPAAAFTQAERGAVYRAIYERRDVRGEFLDREVPRALVRRLIAAAHHAPSVGLMQPWNFILIRDVETRKRIQAAFKSAAAAEEQEITEEKRALYRNLKLEGILRAPLNICVTCDRARFGPTGLGRTQQPDTDLFSTACAVQNLWLAARAEGVGVGWVSILRPDDVKAILEIPERIVIVAYLCVGFIEQSYVRPELEVKRWAERLPVEEMIYEERWGVSAARRR